MGSFRGLLLLLGCWAGCSSPSASARVTITFDGAITAATVATVATMVLHATGDETHTFAITPGRALNRTERVVYRPEPTTRSLGMVVDALDPSGVLVASGSVAPEAIGAHDTVSLTVTLSTTSSANDGGTTSDMPSSDMPAPDMAGSDMAGSDMPAPDMAAILPPSFGNVITVVVPGPSSLTIGPPPETQAGMLLIAMVVTTASSGTGPTFTPPVGWSKIASTSSTSGTPATASWFFKVAGLLEPSSYTFGRDTSLPAAAMITSYSSVNAQLFDSGVVATVEAGTPSMSSNLTTMFDQSLVVIQAFCPDAFDATWGIPVDTASSATYAAPQTVGFLAAYRAVPQASKVPAANLPVTPAMPRILLLTIGIRGK